MVYRKQAAIWRVHDIIKSATTGGVWFSEPYEKVYVVGQRKSQVFTPVMLLGQVSP